MLYYGLFLNFYSASAKVISLKRLAFYGKPAGVALSAAAIAAATISATLISTPVFTASAAGNA
ncbi:MAG TPA: hypothetical protein VN512_03835 [Clostridia bacterium]|nr:hypothetical protein [Clostridia bacterium]